MDELSHYPPDTPVVVDHYTGALGLYKGVDLVITGISDGEIAGDGDSYRVTLEAEEAVD